MSITSITVQDAGTVIGFGFDEIMKYHGPGFPGGVAHAFKVMELGFPLLSADRPIERRLVGVRTPFAGPGARDAFEMVTRAVSEGRYTVDAALAQVQRGPMLKAYYFELTYHGRTIAVRIRPGHVREDFLALGAKKDRTAQEDERLAFLKQEMATRLMSLPASSIYEVAA